MSPVPISATFRTSTRKLRELVGAAGGRGGRNQLRIVAPEHGGAASRRKNDVLGFGENRFRVLGHRAGLRQVTGIPRRLAAAGLTLGEVYLHAEGTEEPHGGDGRGGEEAVHQTGGEEGYFHPVSLARRPRPCKAPREGPDPRRLGPGAIATETEGVASRSAASSRSSTTTGGGAKAPGWMSPAGFGTIHDAGRAASPVQGRTDAPGSCPLPTSSRPHAAARHSTARME